jgi:ATP-dependent DNA helicase RecG
LNAVAHKDYSGLTPIQISVYPDKLLIRNESQLPDQRTIEMLLDKHISKPYNPDIANAFFRGGYVELWGRGFSKMSVLCQKAGQPLPLYYYKTSGIWVEFRKDWLNADELRKIGLNERQIKAVEYVKERGKITNGEYQELNNTLPKTSFRDLEILVEK